MSRRILITNDDGIGADGLRKLAEIARGFGEVTIVAPDTQRSASSHHCVFNRPLTLKAFSFGLRGVEAFTLDGTPADCARVGIFAGSDRKPDLVLSGINHGYNISSDIQYSGTVGAALEAAFLGVRAIAVSYGDPEFKATDIVDRYLPELLPKLMPVQSPMMCAAIYMKKYMNVTDKLAFISPCIAKKNEIDDPNNKGYVSYNLTFSHLVQYLKEHPDVAAAIEERVMSAPEAQVPAKPRKAA